MSKIKLFIFAHKIISFVFLIIIVLITYWGYKKITSTSGDTRYITTKVSKGTIVASVSGTGQVSGVNQIDIKPKVSGNVIYLGVKNGAKVSTGSLIAELDPKDAQKTVRDAETSLASTKLALEKLKIDNSNENLDANSVKAYDDGFNAVTDTFYDLNVTLNGIDDILAKQNLSENDARISGKTAQNYRDKALSAYYEAKTAYEKNNKDYAILNNNSPRTDIKNIIQETYDTTKLLSTAIKNTSNFVDYMAQDSNDSSIFVSYQTTLSAYTNTMNGHLVNLLSAQTNIKNSEDSSQNSSLDIQSAELSVKQKENALQDAKDKLADYFIRAPFSGTITNFNTKILDSVTTGTVVGTLITEHQLALISLNEVDVARIQIGQKATMTFDAIPSLTISGVVSEIDSIGTVSQGVVTYNVKINFDTQDERVKSGMSVSAAIITNMKQDVLIVPNSAIKSTNGTSYVESFNTPLVTPTDGLIGSISKITPNKIEVEVGLSNDRESEIISGIKEGEEIVTRTILPTTTSATTTPSIFGSPATRGGGTRIPAR